MLEILLVFIGGSIGSSLRYFLSSSLFCLEDLFWATFLINVLGSLFLGFVSYIAVENKDGFNHQLKLFLTTGIAGGFTTFSTFNYEIFLLFQSNRVAMGFAYLFLSLFCGLFSIMIGMVLAKRIIEFVPIQKPVFENEEINEDLEPNEMNEELAEV